MFIYQREHLRISLQDVEEMLCGKISSLSSFSINPLQCRTPLNKVIIVSFSFLLFSAQKMEVLRQDVEEIEKEMEELRAYLAKTDEKREEAEDTIDDMDYQDEGKTLFREVEFR